MKLTVRSVDVNYVQQTWPLVNSYLEDALTKGNDFPEWAPCYNIDHVQQYVTAGQWLLLVAVDEQTQIHGACTVSFINYPLHRVAFITCIGGKLISNQETFSQLKLLLKSHGATKIQGSGREAIVRLWKRYNFEPRNTLVEVLL
jgi:hypothetical protein